MTADQSFDVLNSDHSNIRHLFANMLNTRSGGVSSLFGLDRLLSGGAGPWIPNEYDPFGHLVEPGSIGSYNYEAVITATNGGVSPQSIRYVSYLSAPGHDLTIPEAICFCRGTRIATPSGEVPVEGLTVGDVILTADGAAKPIIWIGIGRVLATRGRRGPATPVIVRRGAIAQNVPHRDLHVTKGHSLFLDGVLIPVEFLVNHRSILWDDHAQEVSIYHIELECHDVLLANGIPTESYRDDGNRWLFQNANAGWTQPPKSPCAPVQTGGPIVDSVWRRILERSGPRKGFPLTGDPGLHLLVNGIRLEATSQIDDMYVFKLSGLCSPHLQVHVVSRAAAPQELGLARDPRCLGVAIRRIIIRQDARFQVTEADDMRLVDGFYAFEADNRFRWTDGHAILPTALTAAFSDTAELVLHLGCTTNYVADAACGQAA